MKKRKLIFLSIIIIFTFAFLSGVYLVSFQGNKNEIDFRNMKRMNNIINDRALNLEMMPYDCDWEKIRIDFTNPEVRIPESGNIYKYSSLQEEYNAFGKYKTKIDNWDTSPNLPQAGAVTKNKILDSWLKDNSLVEKGFFYDELPEILFDRGTVAYTQVPIYQRFGEIIVLNSYTDLWGYKNKKEYKVTLNPDQRKFFSIKDIVKVTDTQVDLFSIKEVINLVKGANFKNIFKHTLGGDHYSFCRGKQLKEIYITNADVVYLPVDDEYLYPYVKLTGRLHLVDKDLDFSIIVDVTKSSKLNNSFYIELDTTQSPKKFDALIPMPIINSIKLKDNKYYVKGYLSTKGYINEEKEKNGFDRFLSNWQGEWKDIDYKDIAVGISDTGKYGGVDSPMINVEKQFNDNLVIDEETGHFGTNFQAKDFWKVSQELRNKKYRSSDINSRYIQFKVCFDIENQDLIEAYEEQNEYERIEGSVVSLCSKETPIHDYWLPIPDFVRE